MANLNPEKWQIPEWAADSLLKLLVGIFLTGLGFILGKRSARAENTRKLLSEVIEQLESSWEALAAECCLHVSGGYEGTAQEHLSKIGVLKDQAFSRLQKLGNVIANPEAIKNNYYEELEALTTGLATNKSSKPDEFLKSKTATARTAFNRILHKLQLDVTQGKVKIK